MIRLIVADATIFDGDDLVLRPIGNVVTRADEIAARTGIGDDLPTVIPLTFRLRRVMTQRAITARSRLPEVFVIVTVGTIAAREVTVITG